MRTKKPTVELEPLRIREQKSITAPRVFAERIDTLSDWRFTLSDKEANFRTYLHLRDRNELQALLNQIERVLNKIDEIESPPTVSYASTWYATGPDIVQFYSVLRKGWLARWLGAKDHYGYDKDGNKYLLTPKGWILCSPSS